MSTVSVHKRKYPGRPVMSSELTVLGTDSFGMWLYRWAAARLGDDGWTYDDLEIDLVSGDPAHPVMVLDEDEFDEARRRIPYPENVADAALRARDEVREMVASAAEPFGSAGWTRLEDAMTVRSRRD